MSTVEEAADRIITLLQDPDLRRRLGEEARNTVRKNFLLSSYLERYLDLLNSFETIYRLRL